MGTLLVIFVVVFVVAVGFASRKRPGRGPGASGYDPGAAFLGGSDSHSDGDGQQGSHGHHGSHDAGGHFGGGGDGGGHGSH
jgi:hypothetical protein